MRLIVAFVVLLCSFNAPCAENTSSSKWYTTADTRYAKDTIPSKEEAEEIIAHPIYTELSQQKDYYRIRRLEIITGFAMTQLKQNAVDAVLVGSTNLIPTFFVEGNLWIFRWFGIGTNWTKALLYTMGSQKDPVAPNPVLVTPSWLDLYGRFRYMFHNNDGSSSVGLKIGWHKHDFPVVTYPQYISKRLAQGLDVGVEYKLAFNNMFGINTGLDYLWLPKLQDVSIVPSAQSGYGYKCLIDFYGTVMDKKGLKTMVSIGYGLVSYIADLNGAKVNGDSRSALGVEHFEQTYSNVHLAFTARF
jgi:hypothetical protein